MSPLKRTGAAGMTEQEADDLAERIGRHVRFKVTGRRDVAGKGIHLQVTDHQTGFKHTIHSADHWRQVFNEMVLLVEGAWEEVTIQAIAQLEEEERRCSGCDAATNQLRRVLIRQREVLVAALTAVQRASELSAAGRGRLNPPGTGSIGLVPRRPGMFRGQVTVSGHNYQVHARSYEACAEKLEALKARLRSEQEQAA